MPRNCELSDYERGTIDGLRASNLSYRQIAERINRSHTVVQHYLNNRENYGQNRRTGRPPKLSERIKRHIINTPSNSTIPVRKLANDLHLNVKKSTVWNVLNASDNLVYRKMKVRPALKPHHIERRLEWARSCMHWTKEWQNIVFSDEKKFNLDGPDGYAYYWHDIRKEEKIFSKRSYGGGSVMIWAGFGYGGRTNIAFLNGKGRLNSAKYTEMLGTYLVPFGRRIGGKKWRFQYDNAPIHVSNETKEWLKTNKIESIEWPAISPDINPIENLWGILARRVYANERVYNTVNELIQAINEEWEAISEDMLRNLVDGMPNRIFELISKGGKAIKR